MSAKDALMAYGYEEQADGRFRRPGQRTQVWEPTDDGWLRFEGSDNEAPEIYRLSEDFEGVAGLDKIRHPNAFVWLWPDEEVERIYVGALAPPAEPEAREPEETGP